MWKWTLVFFILNLSAIGCSPDEGFESTQQRAGRVKAAYAEKWEPLKSELARKGFRPGNFEMMIRVMKREKLVEIWLKPKDKQQFRLFKTYAICYYSGGLGPKRKQGDRQVPEGFYSIAVFNPNSRYHLSLGVSYPNSSDKIIGRGDLGGDIMIHGNCVSIGCIPITDTYIKEVYVLALEARNNGQSQIPVYIFPARMDRKGMKYLKDTYAGKARLQTFWKNLKTGYDYFESQRKLPKVSVARDGTYIFR